MGRLESWHIREFVQADIEHRYVKGLARAPPVIFMRKTLVLGILNPAGYSVRILLFT